jgi:hypothetical protein
VSEKYEFIDAEYADHDSATAAVPAPTITQMCTWLEVSKSGFYEWVCHERGGGLDVGRAS